MSEFHVCRFDSTSDIKGLDLTYENIKARVLEIGRFSVFEASDSPKRAVIFNQLMRDPDIEKIDMGYPWVGVKRQEGE